MITAASNLLTLTTPNLFTLISVKAIKQSWESRTSHFRPALSGQKSKLSQQLKLSSSKSTMLYTWAFLIGIPYPITFMRTHKFSGRNRTQAADLICLNAIADSILIVQGHDKKAILPLLVSYALFDLMVKQSCLLQAMIYLSRSKFDLVGNEASFDKFQE